MNRIDCHRMDARNSSAEKQKLLFRATGLKYLTAMALNYTSDTEDVKQEILRKCSGPVISGAGCVPESFERGMRKTYEKCVTMLNRDAGFCYVFCRGDVVIGFAVCSFKRKKSRILAVEITELYVGDVEELGELLEACITSINSAMCGTADVVKHAEMYYLRKEHFNDFI